MLCENEKSKSALTKPRKSQTTMVTMVNDGSHYVRLAVCVRLTQSNEHISRKLRLVGGKLSKSSFARRLLNTCHIMNSVIYNLIAYNCGCVTIYEFTLSLCVPEENPVSLKYHDDYSK